MSLAGYVSSSGLVVEQPQEPGLLAPDQCFLYRVPALSQPGAGSLRTGCALHNGPQQGARVEITQGAVSA